MKKMLLFASGVILLMLSFVPAVQSQSVRDTVLPEGADFATQVLREPWDMDDYSDVSQYINRSGQEIYIDNISVENGIFSATDSSGDAQFFPLWTGYNTAILYGKVGQKFPIDSSKYSCLYVGMQTSISDYWQALWFADERLNGGETWGQSDFQSTEGGVWKLYEMDLASVNPIGGTDSWTANPIWRGLRIDPTRQGSFEIDWVRLTDCTPVTHRVSFDGTGEVSIYLRPQGTTREILVDSGDFSNGYTLDVQGVEPGIYDVLVRAPGALLHSETITVNQAPILYFDTPAFTSGEDYSQSVGNPWDMNTADDVEQILCAANTFSGGVLNLATASNESQPPSCLGGSVSDPRIYLNVPEPINPGEYRYFSFRMHTEGPWQNVPKGMMIRLVWTFTAPGGLCIYVSHDLPFDVGWHEYNIDLWDSFEGAAEVTLGGCPGGPHNWKNSYYVYDLRFDPNENIMGSTLYQTLDWVKLTKNNFANTVQDYPIRFHVNEDDYTSLAFYYTTDPVNNPTQYQMTLFNPEPTQPEGPLFLYLPSILFNPVSYPNSEKVLWETENVSSGEYFICAEIDDGYNSNIFCSKVSVIVE
jgi:hypothetical protein